MRIVTYNIQWGRGKDERVDLARIARAVEGADVIALQEVEAGWKRTGGIDQAAALAALLPAYRWVYGPGFDMDASRVRPDGTVEHRRRLFGNMILARGRILSCRVLPLPKIDVHIHGSMQTAVVEGVVEVAPGRCLRVYNVHLDDVLARERMLQIEALRHWVAAAPREGGVMTGRVPRYPSEPDEGWDDGEPYPPMPASAVVLGDFNATPATAEIDAIVGPRDPRHGRVVTPEFWVDAAAAAGRPEDEPTWYPYPARDKRPPRRLDYIFLTPDLVDSVRRAWIEQDAQGSDHQPVWAELDLP